MRFKSKNTLKFKITFLVLSILILICGMLTYTSIYKNKGETNIAIKKLETSSIALEKAIVSNNFQISSDLEISIPINEELESDISYSTEMYEDENSDGNTDTNERLASVTSPANYVKIGMEPIHTALVDSQANFKNMQITFMIIMVVLGSIITYIILSKFLNPLTKMTNIIENINHNNLDEEIALPKSNDEIYRLSKSFNDMLLRIKNSFEMEKNFSASASHELKTPLSIMKSSIQVLKLNDKPTIEEYEENIEIIEENVEKLIDIVNNLLLLTSNNIGLVEKVDIKQVIDKILLNYSQDLQNKNITINSNLDNCIINSNKAFINCIFENIISNAIKYNKDNGNITISLQKQENNFTFVIEDTGIGISKENLDNIFEPFFREDVSRSKEIKGNGLGLSLVKNIIEKINGNILIESEKEKGTKVILTI